MIGGKEKIEDESAEKKDSEKKSNADSGKIVNLMASTLTFSVTQRQKLIVQVILHGKPSSDDRNARCTPADFCRISNTAAAAYYIYGAPFEIVVASIFLYK